MSTPWYVSPKACTLVLPFEVNGERIIIAPITPVVVGVYDPSGTNLGSASTSFVEGNSALKIEIPAAYNTTAVITSRIVEVDFASISRSFSVSYRLTPRIPLIATHADVIALIGVDAEELPPSDVDLISSYAALVAEYPNLYATNTLAADEVVVASAVLRSLTAIANRLWTKNSDGSISVTRQLNMEALEARATNRLNKALLRAVPDLASTAGALGNISTGLLFGTRTDPVTGA